MLYRCVLAILFMLRYRFAKITNLFFKLAALKLHNRTFS